MRDDQIGAFELRQLLSFRAVAGTGSFHEAAEDLDYTQSAVSQHIAALETMLGVRLFERSRGRRHIALTEAGELLLRHADAIAARLDAARADMRAYAHGATGVLRVGTYQSVGARLLPRVVSRFAEAYPGIEVLLSESPADDRMLAAVESGELDLAFTHQDPTVDGPFDSVELLRDPFMLVVASSSPLARRGSIRASEIADSALLAAAVCRATEAALGVVRRSRAEPRIVFRSDDNSTLQAMARAGLGAALMPLLAVDTADPGIAAVRTDLPQRRVGLAWHRDRYRTPASRAFVEISIEVGAALQRELGVEPAIPASAAADVRAGPGTADAAPATL